MANAEGVGRRATRGALGGLRPRSAPCPLRRGAGPTTTTTRRTTTRRTADLVAARARNPRQVGITSSGSFDFLEDDEIATGLPRTPPRPPTAKPGDGATEEERRRSESKTRAPAPRRNRLENDELTLSLLVQFGEGNLPLKGRTRFQKEEECDPWTQNCKTEVHVWETKCGKCYGTGKVASGFRGHNSKRRARRYGAGSTNFRMMSTCPKCLGTGWVRHSSARRIPSPFPGEDDSQTNLAVARGSFQFSLDDEVDEEGGRK